MTRGERFWNMVEKTENCWNWLGAQNGKGYGQVTYLKRHTYAHRVSFELANGPIPPGKFVCHTCDNRACVNPKHLFLGSPLENMQDMIAKGRAQNHKKGRCGEQNGRAKLSGDAVLEIRQSPANNSEVARKFGVTPTTIRSIRLRKLWGAI